MATRMTKKDYRNALRDPWAFIQTQCTVLNIGAVRMADGAKLPRSTVRSYFNGGRLSPRLEPLNKMTQFILETKGEVDVN